MEDYEKKYKEALSRAKDLLHIKDVTNYGLDIDLLETIFPELNESEDERIRKALVRFHKSTIDIDGIKGADILAWIEKQGKQKQEWSEEDENYLQSAENACEYQYGKNTSTILWLKSLKERVQPKPKEWSEEEKK